MDELQVLRGSGHWEGCGGEVQGPEEPSAHGQGMEGAWDSRDEVPSVCATGGTGTDMSLPLCPALTLRCPWWGTGCTNLSGALQELWVHEHCSVPLCV